MLQNLEENTYVRVFFFSLRQEKKQVELISDIRHFYSGISFINFVLAFFEHFLESKFY